MGLPGFNKEREENDEVVLQHLGPVAKAWTEHLYPLRKEHDLMNANLRTLIGTAVLGLALFAHSIPAWAGQQLLPEVTVGPTFARGSMVGARYSGDSQQYIGCWYFDNNYSGSVACWARDKTGNVFSCEQATSLNEPLAKVVRAITDSSYISFEGARAETGIRECFSLVIENHSSHLQ
jgi:hypothetical protein